MMKRGQIGFGGENIIMLFDTKQGAIYSATKTNKINGSIILVGNAENSTFLKMSKFEKDFRITERVKLVPNGTISFGA